MMRVGHYKENRMKFDGHEFDEIEVVELETAGYGQRVSRLGVILDPKELHHEAGIVTKAYNLVTNREAQDTGDSIIEAAGLEIGSRSTYFNGSVYRSRTIIGERAVDVVPGDAVALAIDIVNSYDGSHKFSLQLNLCRLVCSNGMTVSHLMGGFSFKHNLKTGEIADYLEEKQQIISKLDNLDMDSVISRFRLMTNIKMRNSDIISVNNRMNLGTDTLGRVMFNMEEPNNPTAWDVYNAYTSTMGSLSPSTINKNRLVTDTFLGIDN